MNPPPVPILNGTNSLNAFMSYLCKIHFYIIHHLDACLPSGFLPFGLPSKLLWIFHPFHYCNMPNPSYPL